MRRFFIITTGILFLIQVSGICLAESDFIYRNRVNWVKIVKASPKEVPLGYLKHPYTQINNEQMEAMLLSIKINKKYLLKKEVSSVDVFDSWDARKYAPFFVEGLSKVDGDQVVSFSIIHKRPHFIIRNDFISMGNVWVGDDGVHVQFVKLFAKIEGDYESSSNMDKMIRKAKTSRVTLEPGPGQVLAYDAPREVILDPKYDFISKAAMERQQRRKEEDRDLRGKSKKKKDQEEDIGVSESVSEKTIAERLQDLENLKKQNLITEKEYQELRKKILADI